MFLQPQIMTHLTMLFLLPNSNSSLSIHISHVLSGSSVGASSLDAFQKESAQICINPNPSQPSSYVLETNRNPLDMNQMGTVSLGENHGFLKIRF